MHIAGLDHVQLAMPPGKEAEARQFYGDLLGLLEVEKPEPLAAHGGCWFEGPGTSVHLGVQDNFVPARKAHPAFRVVNLEHLISILAAAGVPVRRDESWPGVRRFYAADPFGNRLEFIQDVKGFPRKTG